MNKEIFVWVLPIFSLSLSSFISKVPEMNSHHAKWMTFPDAFAVSSIDKGGSRNTFTFISNDV